MSKTQVFDSQTHLQKATVKNQSPSSSRGSSEEAKKEHKHRHVDEYSEILAAEPHCHRVFTSFAPKPHNTRFESQASGEHIVLLLRRHPITQLQWMVTALFFAVFPLGFGYFPSYAALPGTYQFGIILFWYLALFGFSFKSFLKWFYHVYILTDERVIDVDFLSLIQKSVTVAKIDNIEDVRAESSGFASTLFDYGTITIQTAGAIQEIIFEQVPNPAKVTGVINDLILEEEREKLDGRVS